MALEYGSLQNMMMGNSKSTEPKIGMGATVVLWTDRHAYTIVAISPSGKTITLQRDTATRTDKDGMSENQEYEYTPNPEGAVVKARMNKHGVWKTLKSRLTVSIGDRNEYYDFSF